MGEMRNVIDLDAARTARPSRVRLPDAAAATYRDVMAQVRALHRVRGFRSDEWTAVILTLTYRAGGAIISRVDE